MRASLLICLLLLGPAVPLCTAQIDSPHSRQDSLLKVATRYLSRGATDSARTLFNVVLTSSKPHACKARLGLVQVDIAENEWQDASHRCDTLLIDNPQDLAAHYYGGISQREWGAELVGIYGWKRAREHFEAVLAKDSLYKDVLYQLALVKEDNRDLEEAIALGYRQVQLRPELPEPQLGLFHIYRHYLSVTKPEEALPYLQRQGNEYGKYFTAEVLRRAQQWMAAEQKLIEIQKQSSRVPAQAPYLSLAQLYAIVNNSERAQYCYWKAVDGIDTWFGAALVFEQLKHIITDRELEEYHSLSSDRQKIAFFHQLWQLRDPMPASAINVRLIEHLQRYSQAEERFEYYGVRTALSNPDPTGSLDLPKAFFLNSEFSDVGVIFLRHGSPNRIEQTMGNPRPAYKGKEDPYTATEQAKEENVDPEDTPGDKIAKYFGNANVYGPTMLEAHQAWVYFASGDQPLRIFHFVLHNSATQNWRLTTLPGNSKNLDKDMLDLLAIYDTRYEKMKKTMDKLQSNLVVEDVKLEQKKVVGAALRTDRHVWSHDVKEFPVPHGIDAFRNVSSGTLLDISYAIPYAPLRAAAGPNAKKVLVEVGLSTTSSGGSRLLDAKRDTLDLLLTPDGSGYYVSLFRQVLVADSVRLSSHVRALNTFAVGTWVEGFHVPSFAGKDFMLSDLQLLLPASYGPLIEIDGVKVQQSPFKSYSRARPIYAYVQVYNLVKDIKGAAGYTARFTLAPKGDPEDATVLAEVKRDLSDENSRSEFQMLDIKGVNPRKYLLTVAVTDRKRVQTISRSREIEITK